MNTQDSLTSREHGKITMKNVSKIIKIVKYIKLMDKIQTSSRFKPLVYLSKKERIYLLVKCYDT